MYWRWRASAAAAGEPLRLGACASSSSSGSWQRLPVPRPAARSGARPASAAARAARLRADLAGALPPRPAYSSSIAAPASIPLQFWPDVTGQVDASRIPELERHRQRSPLRESRREAGATPGRSRRQPAAGPNGTVRLGEVDTIEYQRDRGLGVTVYFGQRKGSASTADLRPRPCARRSPRPAPSPATPRATTAPASPMPADWRATSPTSISTTPGI